MLPTWPSLTMFGTWAWDHHHGPRWPKFYWSGQKTTVEAYCTPPILCAVVFQWRGLQPALPVVDGGKLIAGLGHLISWNSWRGLFKYIFIVLICCCEVNWWAGGHGMMSMLTWTSYHVINTNPTPSLTEHDWRKWLFYWYMLIQY